MADIASLSAVARQGNGKGAARAVRRQGRVPGVVYGSDKDPVSVSLDGKELGTEYHRATSSNLTRGIGRSKTATPMAGMLIRPWESVLRSCERLD